jgi:hypothetical protein
MSGLRDGKLRINDLELAPRALSSVPAGADGQIVPVTDKRGHPLFVRVGGQLVPAEQSMAAHETIAMEVDYATGVSPAANVIITSQAEYNALGAPLKFPQDALDILPPNLSKTVTVKLLAGSHYAKPGVYGFGYALGLFSSPKVMTAKNFLADDLTFFYERQIVFWGEDAETEADQAGTVSSGKIVTRTSGTWTADQHRGKLCLFTSGANAGVKQVIAKNTTTQLTLVGYPPATGACTFTIVEPAATWFDHEFGSANGAGFWLNGPSTGGFMRFNNLAFGTTADRINSGVQVDVGAEAWFQNCTFAIQSPGGYASGIVSPRAFFFDSSFDLDAAYPISINGPSAVLFSGCLIYGKVSYWGLIFESIAGYIDMRYCALRAAPTMSSAVPLIAVWEGKLTLADTTLDGGAGNAQGILVGYEYGPASASITGLTVDNCSTAIKALNQGRVVIHSAISGSGNTNGYVADDCGVITAPVALSGLAAANPIILDGTTAQYSDIPNLGDWLEGPSGSRIVR